MNQAGLLPAEKALSNELAYEGSLTIEETKPVGAAVMRTARTEEVGSSEAREFARGPSSRRTAGSVGRAVMPAKDALCEGSGSVSGSKRNGDTVAVGKEKALTVVRVVIHLPVASQSAPHVSLLCILEFPELLMTMPRKRGAQVLACT